jgi:hypothetical protein
MAARAIKVLGWPKTCELAHAFLSEYSHKKLKLVKLLRQLGVFLGTHLRGETNIPEARSA